MKTIKELNEEEIKQAIHEYIEKKTGQLTSDIHISRYDIQYHPMAQAQMMMEGPKYSFTASAVIEENE